MSRGNTREYATKCVANRIHKEVYQAIFPVPYLILISYQADFHHKRTTSAIPFNGQLSS